MSASWKAQVARVARRFDAFLADTPRTIMSATVGDLLDYLLMRCTVDRVAPSTLRAEASAIDARRTPHGRPSLAANREVRRFIEAAGKAFPRGSRFAGVAPFAPRRLIPHLLAPHPLRVCASG